MVCENNSRLPPESARGWERILKMIQASLLCAVCETPYSSIRRRVRFFGRRDFGRAPLLRFAGDFFPPGPNGFSSFSLYISLPRLDRLFETIFPVDLEIVKSPLDRPPEVVPPFVQTFQYWLLA